jgi:hypothetical protein
VSFCDSFSNKAGKWNRKKVRAREKNHEVFPGLVLIVDRLGEIDMTRILR